MHTSRHPEAPGHVNMHTFCDPGAKETLAGLVNRPEITQNLRVLSTRWHFLLKKCVFLRGQCHTLPPLRIKNNPGAEGIQGGNGATPCTATSQVLPVKLHFFAIVKRFER